MIVIFDLGMWPEMEDPFCFFSSFFATICNNYLYAENLGEIPLQIIIMLQGYRDKSGQEM